MTNKELYNIVKDGDIDKVKSVAPWHHIATGEPFILKEGRSSYPLVFADAADLSAIVEWSTANYKISGKYSDNIMIVLLPSGPDIRIEFKNRKIHKALWIVSSGVQIDITHNIFFIDNVPQSLGVFTDGYVHGTILSDVNKDELYRLFTSQMPDDRITECRFIVSYGSTDAAVCETIGDFFDTLGRNGFKCVAHLKTTIPKWERTIESAKLWAGGNIEYISNNVMTMYDDMRMVNMLSLSAMNRWGVVTYIQPSMMFEVAEIIWDTVVCDGVQVVPVVKFKGTNVSRYNFGDGVVIDSKNNFVYKRIDDFNVKDIGKYCVGDMFVCDDSDSIIKFIKKFGSGVLPTVTRICPKCNQSVDIFNDKIQCVNSKCPAVTMLTLNTWFNKFCPSMSQSGIEEFLSRYEISNLGDIYVVADSINIDKYEGIANGVRKSRETPNIFLNIILPFLEESEAEFLIRLFMANTNEPYAFISNLLTFKNLNSMGFSEDKIVMILEYMDRNKLQFIYILRNYLMHVSTHPLYKKTFFVDGLLYERDKIKYEVALNKYGGRVVNNFGTHVNGYIYGKYADPNKLKAVKELATHKEVAIYSEEEFNTLEKANWR